MVGAESQAHSALRDQREVAKMTPQEAQQVFELIKAKHIQIIDLKFNDLPGLWQHFSMPVSELTEMDDLTKSIWRKAWASMAPASAASRRFRRAI